MAIAVPPTTAAICTLVLHCWADTRLLAYTHIRIYAYTHDWVSDNDDGGTANNGRGEKHEIDGMIRQDHIYCRDYQLADRLVVPGMRSESGLGLTHVEIGIEAVDHLSNGRLFKE